MVSQGIVDAYRTGKGRLHIRGKYHFEEDEKTGRTTIVFTEIPYQVNKARVIERIAELVKEKSWKVFLSCVMNPIKTVCVSRLI